jgi:hypothetical protein
MHEMKPGNLAKTASTLGFLAVSLAAPVGSQVPYDWVVTGVHVTWVEATYMPSIVAFGIDAPAGSCGTGAMLKWNGTGPDPASRQANANAVYSMVIAAKLSGETLSVYGLNADCNVRFIHLR